MTSIASDFIDKYDPPIEYNKILPALFQNNLLEKCIIELDFKDLIKILFSKLDFEKLEKLISLIPEKYYTTHKPTVLAKYGKNYISHLEDLLLFRNDFSVNQQLSLLKSLIVKNPSLFLYQNIKSISLGLMYIYIIDKNLDRIESLKSQKIDNLALLSAAFLTLTTKFTELSDKQKNYITLELTHFYKAYDNIGTFPEAYRAFPLLQKIAAEERFSDWNMNLKTIRQNLISNAPFYMISDSQSDTIITRDNVILTISPEIPSMVKELLYALLSSDHERVRSLLNNQTINEFYESLGSPIEFAKQVGNNKMAEILAENKYIQEFKSDISSNIWRAIYIHKLNDYKSALENMYDLSE